MLGLQVLYVDGKGIRQITMCDHCRYEITNEIREESVFVHKIPVEHVTGKYYAEMSLIHVECVTPFIGTHNTPRGKWYLCYFSDWAEHNVTWREVDMLKVMEQLAEQERN